MQQTLTQLRTLNLDAFADGLKVPWHASQSKYALLKVSTERGYDHRPPVPSQHDTTLNGVTKMTESCQSALYVRPSLNTRFGRTWYFKVLACSLGDGRVTQTKRQLAHSTTNRVVARILATLASLQLYSGAHFTFTPTAPLHLTVERDERCAYWFANGVTGC